MPHIHINRNWIYLTQKRAFDVVCSSLALVFLSPVMLLTALWVRLDSRGPILYRQTRVGENGVEFDMLKFRTMKIDAEDATGPVWAQKDDDRVTRSGRILRKLYLDELPQLLNILRAEMSIVGPRPERPHFYPQCVEVIPEFSIRCLVRPGLTGLAQSRQTHNASLWALRRKFRYDKFYIRRQCFLLDMWIIWKTTHLLRRELKDVKQ